jgi:NADH-quinone oxidoreductase subunit K
MDFFIFLACVIIFLGVSGILLNNLNIIISIICIEVVFYGLNLMFIFYGHFLTDIVGQIASFFVLTIAASESAIALALMVLFFKIFQDIFIEKI